MHGEIKKNINTFCTLWLKKKNDALSGTVKLSQNEIMGMSSSLLGEKLEKWFQVLSVIYEFEHAKGYVVYYALDLNL